MFSRLLLGLILCLLGALVVVVALLDEHYIQGVSNDELAFTKGINQVVSADVFNHADKTARLQYWRQQFSYHISLLTLTEQSLTERPLTTMQVATLKRQGVLADVDSGWDVDDIRIYYYHQHCDCVLALEKIYGEHGVFALYLQTLMLVIITVFSLFAFAYAYRHKAKAAKLAAVFQAYGQGKFDMRANEQMQPPYRALAQQFNQMAVQIDTLIEQQRTLVHGVSHDLRTPIARLRFALDMSRNCHSVDEYQRQVQDMDLDLDELDALVEQWLFYAQLSAKPLPLNWQSINVVALVDTLKNKLVVLYPNIQLTVADIAADIMVQADAQLLSRALENLLINAFKFADTQVLVSIEQVAAFVDLSVEDDGTGVAKAQQANILAPFAKIDEARNSSGCGLGLAIVNNIVDQHQAKLLIGASRLCHRGDKRTFGARFTLRFKANIFV